MSGLCIACEEIVALVNELNWYCEMARGEQSACVK